MSTGSAGQIKSPLDNLCLTGGGNERGGEGESLGSRSGISDIVIYPSNFEDKTTLSSVNELSVQCGS